MAGNADPLYLKLSCTYFIPTKKISEALTSLIFLSLVLRTSYICPSYII